MNIDEDIKILKELAEDTIRYKMVETDAYMAGAITRVLKELEKKDKELETYKKIAEKLAEELEKDYTNCKCCKNLIRHFDMFECKEFTNKKQCIIDWARKEVENEIYND